SCVRTLAMCFSDLGLPPGYHFRAVYEPRCIGSHGIAVSKSEGFQRFSKRKKEMRWDATNLPRTASQAVGRWFESDSGHHISQGLTRDQLWPDRALFELGATLGATASAIELAAGDSRNGADNGLPNASSMRRWRALITSAGTAPTKA